MPTGTAAAAGHHDGGAGRRSAGAVAQAKKMPRSESRPCRRLRGPESPARRVDSDSDSELAAAAAGIIVMPRRLAGDGRGAPARAGP